jgi:hypothetical protein
VARILHPGTPEGAMNKRLFVGSVFPRFRVTRRLAAYADLVDFVRAHRCPGFTDRANLYDAVCSRAAPAGGPVNVIELGVLRGHSLRLWLQASTHPDSRFYGLDTFEGLPEPWQHVVGASPKGTFSAGGRVPDIADPRVVFHKGLIQAELKPLLQQVDFTRAPLIVHFDADLYSATLYGLATLDTVLAPRVRTYIAVFDEFSSANDEFRALRDYSTAYLRDFAVLGHVGSSYDKLAIEISLGSAAAG